MVEETPKKSRKFPMAMHAGYVDRVGELVRAIEAELRV
jgi:hypothetical protein